MATSEKRRKCRLRPKWQCLKYGLNGWYQYFAVIVFCAATIVRGGHFEDLGEHYFDLLDMDKDGKANQTEIHLLFQSVLFLSGLGDVRLDDTDKNINGKTLRNVIDHIFAQLDTSGDNLLDYDEAIAGREQLSHLIGDFLAHNLPKSEF